MYELSRMFCEICKKPFPKLIIKNGKRFTLLAFLEDDCAYIAIQSLESNLTATMGVMGP